MQTSHRSIDGQEQFIIRNAPEKYHDAIRALAFAEENDQFIKSFPENAIYLDTAYANFEKHIETIIKQTAKEIAVDWESAFEAFLQHTYHLNADWWVAGSLALTLRGLPVVPGDIDLTVDEKGSYQWGDALLAYLVEPIMPVTGWFCTSWGRAFLHARIEWTGGVDPASDFDYVQDYYLPSVNQLETINWRGYDIRIPPIEPQLKMDEARGRIDRVQLMKAALNK